MVSWRPLAIHHRLGDDDVAIAIVYNNLAVVARQQGDLSRAVALFEQSSALERRLGVTANPDRYAPIDRLRLEPDLREGVVLAGVARVLLGEDFTWRRTASASLICCGVIL